MRPSLRAALAAAILLAGCGHTPLTSYYALNQVNPATTDLNELRVAVRLSEDMSLKADGVVFTLSAGPRGDDPTISEDFILAPLPTAQPQLRRFERTGDRLYAFALRPEDRPRFEQTRAAIADAKERLDYGGSIAVAAQACYESSAPPAKILLSTFLHASEIGRYTPLMLDVDLHQQAEKAGASDLISKCS